MAIDYSGLPEHMREGARGYIEHGAEPGGFLRAVLENDLVGAAVKADAVNLVSLQRWAKFLYNQAPAGSWGSREAVNEWIRQRKAERA